MPFPYDLSVLCVARSKLFVIWPSFDHTTRPVRDGIFYINIWFLRSEAQAILLTRLLLRFWLRLKPSCASLVQEVRSSTATTRRDPPESPTTYIGTSTDCIVERASQLFY